MRKSTIVLKMMAVINDDPVYKDTGITLNANVSAARTTTKRIAEQDVAYLTCTVMSSENPTDTDPAGVTRSFRKDDAMDFETGRWLLSGPMSGESRDLTTGDPVNYRFDVERPA